MNHKHFATSLPLLFSCILSLCPVVPCEEIPHHQIVIAGAGLPGLISAYYLRDYDVQILESSQNAGGGKSLSDYYQMFAYSKSMPFPNLPKGAMRDIAEQLNLSPVRVSPPAFSYYYAGPNYYDTIPGLIQLLKEHSQPGEFETFQSTVASLYINYKDIPFYSTESPIAALDSLTVKEWFEKEKFPAFYLEYFNAIIRGIYNANVDELSAMTFLRWLGETFCSQENSIDATQFYTFKNGMKDLLEPLCASLQNNLLYGQTVLSISRSAGKMLVQYLDKNNTVHKVTADAVISSIAAKGTISLASGCLSAEQIEIGGSIPYSSSLRMYFKVAKPSLPSSGELFYPVSFFFNRIAHRTGMIPSTLLGAPQVFYCYIPPQNIADVALTSLTDAEILAKTVADIAKIAPLINSSIMESSINRYKSGHPVFTVHSYERMARLNTLQGNGFYFDQDFLTYPTLEGAMDAGYLTAAKVRQTITSSTKNAKYYQ